MSIKTEYRGYTITYSENADEWNSYECGVSHASLSKVKAKIDAMHLKMRKESAVECLELTYNDTAIPATLIEYVGPVIERIGSFGSDRAVTGHRVAAIAKRRSNERPSRSVERLDKFAANTPDALAAIAAWQEAIKAEKLAHALAKKRFDEIPRITLDDIEGLVRASSAKIEEGAE